MALLSYEEGIGRKESMRRTIFASIIIFMFALLSLASFQFYGDNTSYWVRESREFFKIINNMSDGIAFCYSGNSSTTAFAISEDGWYITAGHKVNRDFPEANKIHMKLNRERDAKTYISEKIIAPPENQDILLFKVNYKPKYYFKNFKKPYMFEENWIFGFRGSSGKVLSPPGYVTRDLALPGLLRTTARASFGQSGGPVINRDGHVLGVAILINTQSLDCLFMPSQVVQKYIKENLK